jgi:hypothetical protein
MTTFFLGNKEKTIIINLDTEAGNGASNELNKHINIAQNNNSYCFRDSILFGLYSIIEFGIGKNGNMLCYLESKYINPNNEQFYVYQYNASTNEYINVVVIYSPK